MKRLAALLLLALAFTTGFAKDAAPLAEDPVVEKRLIEISEEMRCLVCQNESLAGSRSDLAQDLRRELREQIKLGRSDAQIREFMVSRYGDFVLYRPPVKPITILLWSGPFLLMAVGVIVLLVYLRRRNRALGDEVLTEEENSRADGAAEGDREMTGFIVGALLALALTLALLLRPFYLRQGAVAVASQRQLNAAILREQLAKLDQDLADGTLAAEDYGQARAELQRRVLQDTSEVDAAPTLHAPRRTMLALGITVPAVALGLYMLIGSPASMDPAAGNAGHVGQQDLEKMVTALAQKLEKEPDNLKGWAMLARSYKVLNRNMEAELAFERAGAIIDDDAQMLANYADVAASNAGGNFKGKPAQLIEKALKADPQNAMALWLSGTEAMSRNDYDRALATWGKLLPLLAPGSEDERMLQGAMDEVRARAGKGAPLAAAPAAAPAPAAATPTPTATAASTSKAGVSGTVELAPALKARAAPGDTVMVIARLPGTRMPLAVMRAPASQLPLAFKLDDSMAMNPQALLSTAGEVEVEARISKSGMAMPEAGDLLSAAKVVKIGTGGIVLQVERVRN